MYISLHHSVKKALHRSYIATFFRQAILEHTFKRTHLLGSLALYETAEPQ